MTVSARRADFASVRPWREQFRREMTCQIVHDSLHERPGWVEWYLLSCGSADAGYGAVVTGGPWAGRREAFEFFVASDLRAAAFDLFERFIAESRAGSVRAQTNDPHLSALLLQSCRDIRPEILLFADGTKTRIPSAGAVVRPLSAADRGLIFERTGEPVGDWGLDLGGEIIATGAFATHYNPPFVDLYMEVRPDQRRRGYGSYLAQELKRLAVAADKMPCARCNLDNVASRKTLLRAGMIPCGLIIRGKVGAG